MTEIVATVYTNCEYAPYVEFGTGVRGAGMYPYGTNVGLSYSSEWMGQAPQPYLGRSLNQNINKVKQIIREGVANV